MKHILKLLIVVALASACKKTDSDCIDQSLIDPDALCTLEYDPVCGCDGKTYGNACAASIAGVLSTSPGECD